VTGDWAITVEDGTHAVHADIISGLLNAKLKITWDGEVLVFSPLYLLLGDLTSFQHNGHAFVLRVRGWGKLGSLVLTMDGVEIPQGGRAVPARPTAAPAAAAAQFVKELSVSESEEIVGTEEYPLDNRFGDQAFSTIRQVSRESTNELSLDTSSQLCGKVGIELFSVIKAEIEAQVSEQLGQKIGQKVTESQTLNFAVGPHATVVYQVVWKRRVRSGERLYLSGSEAVTVPYRINYGLSCEVRTVAQPVSH